MRNLTKFFKRNLKDAWQGLVYIFRFELSFKIQIFFALITLFFTFYFPLKLSERIVIILLIGFVLILEIVNTVIERLIDLFRPRIDEAAKIIKDLMAGCVLILSIISLIIGFLIFLPYFKALLLP
jgi:diacylglycerol kinase